MWKTLKGLLLELLKKLFEGVALLVLIVVVQVNVFTSGNGSSSLSFLLLYGNDKVVEKINGEIIFIDFNDNIIFAGYLAKERGTLKIVFASAKYPVFIDVRGYVYIYQKKRNSESEIEFKSKDPLPLKFDVDIAEAWGLNSDLKLVDFRRQVIRDYVKSAEILQTVKRIIIP